MFKCGIKPNKHSIFSEVCCDVDLMEDIDFAISQMRYDVQYDEDEEYDPDCGLEEHLWIEEKQKQRLRVLEKRNEYINDLSIALEKLAMLTDIELSELQEQVL